MNGGGGSCLALVPQATGADLGICVREGGTAPAQLGGIAPPSGSGVEPQKPTLFALKRLRKLRKKETARRLFK